jgi:hypothetical protein
MENDDISHTIIAKSDQLNACDLLGGPITVTVEKVNIVKSADQPVSISIGGGHQPFKPCLTVRRILAKLWGPKSSQWIGRSMTLYCDESVVWAGERAGGIRISHMTHINGQQSVTTRASKHKTMSYIIDELVFSLPSYPDENITKNAASWAESFAAGKTPQALIKSIKTKFTLTPEQEATITNMANNQEAK